MQKEHPPLGQLVCYGLILLAAYLVSTSSTPLRILDYRVDLLICVPAAVALMDGPYMGMAFGVATGIAYDMAMTGVEGLYPIYFMVFGVAAGLFARRFLRRIFPSMLLLTVACVVCLAAFRLLGMFILQLHFDLLLYLQRVCGEAMLTAVLSPLVYFPAYAVYQRAH